MKFSNFGHCPCCDQDTEFAAENDWWRESYVSGSAAAFHASARWWFALRNCSPAGPTRWSTKPRPSGSVTYVPSLILHPMCSGLIAPPP